jgi:DNA-binding transcriptional MocR family regulator
LRNSSIVSLGSLYPDPSLFPVDAINRLATSVIRELPFVVSYGFESRAESELRLQLANRSTEWGLSLSADDFIITTGFADAVSIALSSITKPGDLIAVESPTYYRTLQVLERLGLYTIEVPTHPQMGLDIEMLSELLRRFRLRAIVGTATGSTPLGAVMPNERKRYLAKILSRYEVPFLEDDSCGELCLDSCRPKPIKVFDRANRVILCGSVSRTLGPGLCVGWVVPGRYKEQLQRRMSPLTTVSSPFSQLIVARYLASGAYNEHLQRLRVSLSEQSTRLREAISINFPQGTRSSRPRAGSVLWVELPHRSATLDMLQPALDQGISLAVGPMFTSRNRFDNSLCISCGLPWSRNVEMAVRAVAELVSKTSTKHS